MHPNLNANYRAALARQISLNRRHIAGAGDPFLTGLPRAWGGLRDEAAPSFFDDIIAKAKQTVDIAGYQIPYWGIGAAALGAFYFMKKR